MLMVTDVTAYLRQAFPYTYVANEFGASNGDDCAFVRMTGGLAPSEWTSKSRPSFQVVIRAKSSAIVDAKANEIHAGLHGKAEFTIGTARIVKCIADQSTPLYLGKDANGRTIYSANFTLTTI
ncbi:minor capsid protein [Paenibacillus sp. SC116]|uniref:minor capsid protein n=1 Tax=Paenibacillus sp. SC116 TaxID=2968986 RepID=UPI00215B6ADF|nr:minor capsid protein [Paenibacillus sp. SC116]MCR8843081.1 minor capsid protein [Paenibacillus sp. SC116]